MIAEALTFAPVDLVLRDGETVRVRPVQPDDEPRLVAFLEDLPAEARAFRLFSGGLSMRRAARYAMSQLDAGGFGLVAVAGEPSVVVAHAMCSRPRTARPRSRSPWPATGRVADWRRSSLRFSRPRRACGGSRRSPRSCCPTTT